MTVRLELPPQVGVVVEGRPFAVRCSPPNHERWTRCERELEERRVPIPLDHRRVWVETLGTTHRLISAHDADDRCLAAFAVALSHTRAAPGYVIARAERLGPCADVLALRAAIGGWTRIFAPVPRILRLEAAILCRDTPTRSELGRQLSRAEFRRLPHPRSYERTTILRLEPSEEALFASLHATARRHIRAAVKKPVRLEAIRDDRHRDAMRALLVETRRRTGGDLPAHAIDEVLTVACEHPERLRIIGLFSEDDGRLLAFASGFHDGDHVTYRDAASTRDDTHRFPLGYAPLWELVRWAKQSGATWFDLGGITAGRHEDTDDRLGGISDFKRYFRGEEQIVGEEWVAEPRALVAAIASGASRVARWARGKLADLERGRE